MERPLGLAETTFWLFDRASSMNFTVFADGTGLLSEKALQTSAIRLMRRHPLLRCSIHRDKESGLLFKESDAAGNIAGVTETYASSPDEVGILPEVETVPGASRAQSPELFRSFCDDQIATLMARPFELEHWPLWRVLLIQGKGRFRVALVFHHSIADGRSGLRLLHELMDGIDGKPGSTDDREASTGPADLEAGPQKDSLNKEILPRALHDLLSRDDSAREVQIEQNPGKPPAFLQKRREGHPIMRSFKIDAQTLEKLKALAKQRGATVHGILGATLLRAVQGAENYYLQSMGGADTDASVGSGGKSSAGSPARRVSLASPLDLRSELSDSSDSLALYISLITTTVDSGDDIWSDASAITQDIRHQRKEAPLGFYRHLPEPSRYLGKPDPGKAYAALMQRLPQAAALSNAGTLPTFPASHNNSWNIESVAFTVHPAISQSLFAAVATYEGVLCATIQIDAHRWPDGLLDELVRLWQEGLQDAARS